MGSKKIALKPYLEKIAVYCDGLTDAQLKAVILSLAKDIPTSERVDYLEKFKASLPDGDTIKEQKITTIEKTLQAIEELQEDIQERIESIGDGSYWDHSDRWDNGQYYDEDPDLISENQVSELIAFFDDAKDLFIDDRLDDARKIYQALFDLIETFAEEAYFPIGYEVDVREARARYSRCVYETVNQSDKLVVFAAAMDIDRADSGYLDGNIYDKKYPLMQDVIETRVGEMENMETFLPAWRQMLENGWPKIRGAVLLLETVYRLEGLDGVSKLARKWKNDQPAGFLYWLDALQKQNELKKIVKVSAEGLKVLQNGHPRERVARFLIDAATGINDINKLLAGRRERFFSHPNDQNLLEWLAEADNQGHRVRELNKAIDFFKSTEETNHQEQGLYIKCLLMAGRLNDAFEITKGENGVGWSYGSSTGIVFGAVLSSLTGHSEKASATQELLRGYAHQRSIYSGRFTTNDEMSTSFYEEIITGLKNRKLKTVKRDQYLAWVEKIGRSRINHIVSNQYRNAYSRAAQVLGALAETYFAMGRDNDAIGLVNRFYNEKFKRFRAFRREVKTVLAGSDLLKNVKL